MIIDFKFAVFQYVTITHFSLHCEGRIVRCIRDNGPINIYDVDYCIDGNIKRAEFYEDELTARP